MFVPEATNLHSVTLDKLKNVDYNDLYISETSPLGVPFNTLRENINEEKHINDILKEIMEIPVSTAILNLTQNSPRNQSVLLPNNIWIKIQAIKEQGLTGEALEKALNQSLLNIAYVVICQNSYQSMCC